MLHVHYNAHVTVESHHKCKNIRVDFPNTTKPGIKIKYP